MWMLCMTEIVMLVLPRERFKKEPKTDKISIQVLKNKT